MSGTEHEAPDHIQKNKVVVIAQWLAWQFATGEVPDLNPAKGDIYSF